MIRGFDLVGILARDGHYLSCFDALNILKDGLGFYS